jgi:hypothetical protein
MLRESTKEHSPYCKFFFVSFGDRRPHQSMLRFASQYVQCAGADSTAAAVEPPSADGGIRR